MFLGRHSLLLQTLAIDVSDTLKVLSQSVHLLELLDVLLQKIRSFVCAMLRDTHARTHAHAHTHSNFKVENNNSISNFAQTLLIEYTVILAYMINIT